MRLRVLSRAQHHNRLKGMRTLDDTLRLLCVLKRQTLGPVVAMAKRKS